MQARAEDIERRAVLRHDGRFLDFDRFGKADKSQRRLKGAGCLACHFWGTSRSCPSRNSRVRFGPDFHKRQLAFCFRRIKQRLNWHKESMSAGPRLDKTMMQPILAILFLVPCAVLGGVSHHSGFHSLASPETYLEACAAAGEV